MAANSSPGTPPLVGGEKRKCTRLPEDLLSLLLLLPLAELAALVGVLLLGVGGCDRQILTSFCKAPSNRWDANSSASKSTNRADLLCQSNTNTQHYNSKNKRRRRRRVTTDPRTCNCPRTNNNSSCSATSSSCAAVRSFFARSRSSSTRCIC